MVTKKECIDVFNSMLNRRVVSFDKKLLPMISDYLTENNIENSEELIKLLLQNPDLVQMAFPKVIDYFCKKYCIFSLIYLNKIILYYE